MSVHTSSSPSSVAERPAARPSRGDLLFGFGRRERDAEGRPRVRILWARLLRVSAITAIVGWFVLAGAGWAFVHWRQGVAEVTYLDIAALPFRWTEYQRKRGDFYIARGKEMFSGGDYRGAFQMFRVGVAKSPGNLEGRNQLALMYGAFLRRPEEGIRILEEGRPAGDGDHAYFQTLLGLLLANQQDDRVRQIADERLALAVPETNAARLYALFAAQACFARGHFDAAESYFEKYGLMKSKEGKLLAAQILWERGLRAVAAKGVSEVLGMAPKDEQAHALHIAYLKELGQTFNVLEAARQWRAQVPGSADARVAVIRAYADAGDTTNERREIEAMLASAGKDQRMVFALADYAASSGNAELAGRIGALAESAGLPAGTGELIALDARVAARNYREVLSEIEALNARRPAWLAAQASALASMQAVASFGLGDADMGELYLTKYLGQQALQAAQLLVVAKRLDVAGAPAAARRALALAAEIEPQNQAVLARVIEADLSAGETQALPDYVARLLDTRRPSLDLLNRALAALESDVMMFVPGRDDVIPKVRAAIMQRGS